MYNMNILGTDTDFLVDSLELDLMPAKDATAHMNFMEMDDDFAGDATTTGVVTIDAAGTLGTLETSLDDDWFAFTINAGESVRFSAEAAPGSANPLQGMWNLFVRDADGTILATPPSNPGGLTQDDIFFAAEATGTYFLHMNGRMFRDPSTTGLGEYIVMGTSVIDDFADDTSTTGSLAFDGSPIAGFIDTPDDVDWFEISVVANEQINIRIEQGAEDSLASLISVVDASGVRISDFVIPTVGEGYGVLQFAADFTGTAYVQVESFSPTPFSNLYETGSYEISATVVPSAYNLIVGTTGHDYIEGTTGQDEIDGSGGDDVLKGFAGDDKLFGGNRNDTLFGHNGDDDLFGENGRDKLVGGNGEDFLSGGVGNDLLRGGNDRDTLHGGSQNDRLFGNDGDDYLLGGSGNDTLYGGEGFDFFAFSDGDGNDRVMDFDVFEDFLDFSNHNAFNSAADVFAAAVQHGTTVVISYGTDEDITLLNTSLTDLETDGAFIF